MTTMNTWFTDM